MGRSYVVECVDVSTERVLGELWVAELSEAMAWATRRAGRLPPNTLVRFDFWESGHGHVFSVSPGALVRRARSWMS
jgi:hypothetical protein